MRAIMFDEFDPLEMLLTASDVIVKPELTRWLNEGRVRPVSLRFPSAHERVE